MSLDLFKTLAGKKGVKDLHKFSKWDEGVIFGIDV